MKSLIQAIASAVDAYNRCKVTGNTEWRDRWQRKAQEITEKNLPSGSGFDHGTTIDLERSTGEKVVFNTSFHHMNEHGSYAGWTYHRVTVTPAFIGSMRIAVTGRNRNDIGEYVAECFQEALSKEVDQ